jgi:hypothetical protein
MSPVVYREDESSAWGVVAIVMVVALFALMIGYFAWWRPANVNAESRQPDVINVQPPATQPSPTVIPVPVPGPQGPAGAPGPAGPAAPAQPAPAPEPVPSTEPAPSPGG